MRAAAKTIFHWLLVGVALAALPCLSLHAFSRYLANPNLSVDAVQHDWAIRRGFSPNAAP